MKLRDSMSHEDLYKVLEQHTDWGCVSTQPLDETFIALFYDKLDWTGICINSNLSEACMRKFKYYVDWKAVSEYQRLTETFMSDFRDDLDWDLLLKHQVMSEEFIDIMHQDINMTDAVLLGKISEPYVLKFRDFIDPKVFDDYMNALQENSDE